MFKEGDKVRVHFTTPLAAYSGNRPRGWVNGLVGVVGAFSNKNEFGVYREVTVEGIERTSLYDADLVSADGGHILFEVL